MKGDSYLRKNGTKDLSKNGFNLNVHRWKPELDVYLSLLWISAQLSRTFRESKQWLEIAKAKINKL